MVVEFDIVTWFVDLLFILGAPLLIVLFYLDGLVIGKLLPRSVLFVAYVTLVQPGTAILVVVSILCAIGTTAGQLMVYRAVRADDAEITGIEEYIPLLDRIPDYTRRTVGKRRMAIASNAFDRFGGASLLFTNLVPGLRGILTLPAAVIQYPVHKFILYSGVGNLVYMILLLLVAAGVVQFAGAIPFV